MKRFLYLFVAGLAATNGVCASLQAFSHSVAERPLEFFGWSVFAALMFVCAYLSLEGKR